MHIYLAKYKIFLRKGALSPATPARGPAPGTPVNASRKRSVCSQLFEPPNVENLPKPMLTILCLYKFALKMLFLR